MSSNNEVRKFSPDEWSIYKELRLNSLADSPDAFGKTLAEEQTLSDDEWLSRLLSGVQSDKDLPLIAEVNGQPAGLAWGRIEESKPDTANLYQMWVAPNYRLKGIGSLLLETIIVWAETKNVRYIELGVAFKNSRALRLYKRYGFLPVGKPHKFRQGSDMQGQKMRLEIKKGAS